VRRRAPRKVKKSESDLITAIAGEFAGEASLDQALAATVERLRRASRARSAPPAERAKLAAAAEEIAASLARSATIDGDTQLFAGIVDALPLGLYVVDREYRVHAWNRSRETGTQGVRRDLAMGRTIFDVLRRQAPDLLRREFDEVFADGRVRQFEMESRATGEVRMYRVSKIPMRMDGLDVTHVITLGEDITDAKRAQARAAQAEKLAAVGQLAAGVMHEVNNPLATVGACAETLALQLPAAFGDEAARARALELCNIIDLEVQRAKRIVNGVLDFSRPSEEAMGPVPLGAVVDEALLLLRHHARFKRVAAERVVEPGLPPVIGSAPQLVQVLVALLLNAADAMEGAGSVLVRAARDGNDAMLEVTDRGHGIAPGDLARVFEPFYSTKPPGRGTGLGLAICFGLVRDHGGRIEVESAVGRGSTFRVRIPIASGVR
jgi:two-component system NtrC family sensor kinase